MKNSKVVSSFSWKLAERILIQGGGFLVQVLLARILHQSDFASLAILTAVTNYANILVQSGLSTSIIQKEDLDELDVSTLLVASLFIALVLYCGIFVFAPFLAKTYDIVELESALRVLGLILFLNAINSIQLGLLQRKMAFKRIFFRSLLSLPIAAFVAIILAVKGFGIWALVAYNLVNVFMLVVIMSFSQDFRYSFRFSISRAKSLYSFNMKIMGASLISGFYSSLSTMVIGKKYSADDLAYYDKGYQYSYYAVTTIGYSISSVMLPVLSRLQDNLNSLKNTNRHAMQVSVFFMFPVLFGLSAASKTFVQCLLTDKWIPCAIYLSLFCILRLPECMITLDKQAYYAIGRSDIALKYELGLCFANFISLMVTMRFGILYIAIGAVIVQLLASVAVAFISQNIYGYSARERMNDVIKPFINSIIMFVAVRLVSNLTFNCWMLLIIEFCIGAIVYFALAFLEKDNNLNFIYSQANRIKECIIRK